MIPQEQFLPRTTWEKVLDFIGSSEEPTPYLLIDSDQVKAYCLRLRRGFPDADFFYAMKANPSEEVVSLVNKEGFGFEIASEGELRLLRTMGVPSERIISSNPVKSPWFVEEAYDYGIRYFAYDSEEEIEKFQRYAPEARCYVRISVSNEGSQWPLTQKFGVSPDEALRLLEMARDAGLRPAGVTFHVGSQCLNPANWATSLTMVQDLFRKAEKRGIELELINLGGGFPVRYIEQVVPVEDIEALIVKEVKSRFPSDIKIHIEPGRAVVAEAGVMVSRVIGKARRAGQDWLYIDVGVFNGLMEAIGGIEYTFVVGSRAEKKKWTIAGPSCDSFDIIQKDVILPEPQVGDLVLILSAGAYTVSYASEFNGFSIPRTIVI